MKPTLAEVALLAPGDVFQVSPECDHVEWRLHLVRAASIHSWGIIAAFIPTGVEARISWHHIERVGRLVWGPEGERIMAPAPTIKHHV